MFHFRDGTCDFNVFYDVALHNQYELPKLNANDGIVDIGVHIGSFIHKAYSLGSRRILGFEANRENYLLAVKHLNKEIKEGSVEILNRAVWKPDAKVLHHSGFTQDRNEINTGGGHVFADSGEDVLTVSLDDIILTRFGPIDYLKLDCEGSEFPILASCTTLDKIQHIVLEYHEMNEIPDVARTEALPEYTIGALTDFLRWYGFERTKEYRHGDSNLGMAWFKKIEAF